MHHGICWFLISCDIYSLVLFLLKMTRKPSGRIFSWVTGVQTASESNEWLCCEMLILNVCDNRLPKTVEHGTLVFLLAPFSSNVFSVKSKFVSSVFTKMLAWNCRNTQF